jgi:glycogen phosphorylase
MQAPGTPYSLEVNPNLPERLARLEELAGNLWYSWDRPTQELFERLHPALWNAVGHNPKAFLRRVDERRLVHAAGDPVFRSSFEQALSAYDAYLDASTSYEDPGQIRGDDLIAYFCAEFGFHESLPIYSGGLGILAGDHCKAASDMGVPLVGIGLLYRQGYFSQTIDGEGNQGATYADSDFSDLPVELVTVDGGADLRVSVELPGRSVALRVWRASVGRVKLFLLDTDVPENDDRDRGITYRLYGGDRIMRIEQEIVLGVGGVRALAQLGLRPTIWHMNEGHAAFLVLERVRMLRQAGLDFASALEAVAVNTVFTTHTAVPAGHDHFPHDMLVGYFSSYALELGINNDTLFALGNTLAGDEFDMTALAVRGSRFHNGVSRLHGQVSATMLKDLWPQVPAEENPIDYVTNGVHVPTFLSLEWIDVFDRFLGPDWRQRMQDPANWRAIDGLPDDAFWSVHQFLKSRMLQTLRQRVRDQHFRNRGSEAHLDRLLKLTDPVDPNVLTIGFGRRFATYKRATLLFENLNWLEHLVSDAERPVLFVFAGRAHPADVPGQDLIRTIAKFACLPFLEGKVLLLEGYDLQLARALVSGVDVWLNNPVHPLEASGTSGMKAGMNGVINLSVLDGWWAEGYDGNNGWAIKPAAPTLDQAHRDREESRTLYEILQDQVIPMFYDRDPAGYSPKWIGLAKRSIASILPRYNATRMVGEYVSKFYGAAAHHGRRYNDDSYAAAKAVAAWKARVRAAWPGVALRRVDVPQPRLKFGQSLRLKVAVTLNGLAPEDVVVELLLGVPEYESTEKKPRQYRFAADGAVDGGGKQRFVLELAPEVCGRLDYRIRAYPWHELLAHPFELGLMVWS